MKLTDKISWLTGRVQRSLFPHLNEKSILDTKRKLAGLTVCLFSGAGAGGCDEVGSMTLRL